MSSLFATAIGGEAFDYEDLCEQGRQLAERDGGDDLR